MKRILVLVVALGLLAACESSGSGGEERSVDELSGRAAEITDQLAQNDWEAVRKDFDTTMAKELTEDGLQAAWDQVVEARGEYQSRGEPSRVLKSGDIVVFDTPMAFEQGEMKSRDLPPGRSCRWTVHPRARSSVERSSGNRTEVPLDSAGAPRSACNRRAIFRSARRGIG